MCIRDSCSSVTPFRKRRCRSRHVGEWPGWPSGLAGEFPVHPSGRSSRARRNGNRKNRTRSYMNRRMATENLRKRQTLFFYVSYGILTEFLRMNVILTYFCNGSRRYGYGGTETYVMLETNQRRTGPPGSGRFVKQEQWERWRAKRKLVSGSSGAGTNLVS